MGPGGLGGGKSTRRSGRDAPNLNKIPALQVRAPARTVWVGAGAFQWYLAALVTNGWGRGCSPQPWGQYLLALHPMEPPGMAEIGLLVNRLGGNLERKSKSKKGKDDVSAWGTTAPRNTEWTCRGCRARAGQHPGHPRLRISAVYWSLRSSEFSGTADLAPKIITGRLQEIKEHKSFPQEQRANWHLRHLPWLNPIVSESLISSYLGSFSPPC